MKVIEKRLSGDEELYEDDGAFELEIDGKKVMSAKRGCIEDWYLMRDLDFVYNITDWIKMAHEAGLRGESLDISTVKVDRDWYE